MTLKQETIKSIKVLQEVMTIMEKQDKDKTCMDSKRKILKHMIGKRIKNSKQTQISLKKQYQKLQKIKELLKIKCYTTQKLNKNTPKLLIPHDVIPLQQLE